MEELFEIAKYTIPAIVVLITAVIAIKSFLSVEDRKRAYEIRLINQKAALPIRLQAYERLTLFLERIAPNSLIQRVRRRGMSANDLHLALIKDIRKEFEHNLSQQIYVSTGLWFLVSRAKEEMITLINRIAVNLPNGASEKVLSKDIFEYFMENEKSMPTLKALYKLKTEVKSIY